MNLSLIHKTNPYDGLTLRPLDLQGWQSYEQTFEDLISEVRPKLIVEVGTWKGASAIHMANLLVKYGLTDSKIVCVDTWLGSLEFWTNQEDPERYASLNLVNGYPSVYYTFLSNVVRSGHEKTIIPFPATSQMAADWFKKMAIIPDLCYLDASHEYNDVLWDLMRWANISTHIFGDDYTTFEGVRRAVHEFNAACHDPYDVETRESKWILR